MFNGLYKVISKSENEAVVQLSDKKHPIFKAHFPMHPVLPGFVHFEIVENIFDFKITTIKKAKFMALVTPKQRLRYEKNANKFHVFREDELVASFSL
jgi:3-hydroxymyristoyl/3-hydroxydecanoyl-(acyl carrier protein) dehydratase